MLYTPETNITLYINHPLKKKKKECLHDQEKLLKSQVLSHGLGLAPDVSRVKCLVVCIPCL